MRITLGYRTKWQLMKPGYWPTWCLLGLLYLLVKLPYRWQLNIGRGIGRFIYLILPRRRRIAHTNIQLCFPELSATKQQERVKAHFASFGIGVMETAMAWWMPKHKLKKLTHITGTEYLQEALQSGKGILLLGAHFTTIDIIGCLTGLMMPICVVYREQNNAVVDFMLKRYRKRGNVTIIYKRDIRGIIRALKNNAIVWYAPDQDYGLKYSVFAPFFEIPAATITMPARLAKISQTQVLPCCYYRMDNAAGYQLIIYPALQDFPSGDPKQDASRVNQAIENAIRQKPEQYLWMHRRFKRRPKGEASLY